MESSQFESLALQVLEAIENQDFEKLSQLFADNFVLKALMFPVGKDTAMNMLKSYLNLVVPQTFEPRDFFTDNNRTQVDLHLQLKGKDPVRMKLRCWFEFEESQVSMLQIRPC